MARTPLVRCVVDLCTNMLYSHAIWDHVVLPATRQTWVSRLHLQLIKTSTRFSDPGGMQGWVYKRRWYTRVKTVTTLSTNRARRRVTSFMQRTTLPPNRQPDTRPFIIVIYSPVKLSFLMARSWLSASSCDLLASSWSRTCWSSYDWPSSASMSLFSPAITCRCDQLATQYRPVLDRIACTRCLDAAYCYTVLLCVWNNRELCKNGWTDPDAV